MHNPLQLLTNVLAPEAEEEGPYAWEDLLGAVHEVTSAPLTQEVEGLLVAALRFEGRFRLTPTSGRPHRLSPEDMVKSLAIQALGRWGAADHLAEIERIESTARSPGLASVARATAQQLRRAPEQSVRAEGSAGASESRASRGGPDPHNEERRAVNGINDFRGGSYKAGTSHLSGLAEDLASLSEPVAEQFPMNPEAANGLRDTYDAYEARDLERALALLRRWGRYISAAMVAYLRGSICLWAKEYAAAAMFYRRCVELEPGNVTYARVYLDALDKSDPDAAIALAQQILANADRRHPSLVISAGASQLAFLRDMDDGDAQAGYNELSRIMEMALTRLHTGEGNDSAKDSTLAMALWILGFCRDHLGDTEGALRWYDAGLAAFPSHEGLLVSRGILRYENDTPGAVLDFQNAIQIGSLLAWPYFYMAHHYLVNSRPRECLATCERALKIQASDTVRANLYEWMAISRSDLGLPPSEVRVAFEEAIRLDPRNERIRKNHRAFEESINSDGRSLRVWEKPDGAYVRAYGRAEYRLAA
jgi:tetratricopeptide (TPR) repeat protein